MYAFNIHSTEYSSLKDVLPFSSFFPNMRLQFALRQFFRRHFYDFSRRLLRRLLRVAPFLGPRSRFCGCHRHGHLHWETWEIVRAKGKRIKIWIKDMKVRRTILNIKSNHIKYINLNGCRTWWHARATFCQVSLWEMDTVWRPLNIDYHWFMKVGKECIWMHVKCRKVRARASSERSWYSSSDKGSTSRDVS